MNIPFQLGAEYRYKQLAESVGSAVTQSGIIWEPGKKNKYGFVIVTSGGNKSKSLGYDDRRNPDGSWLYYGQKNVASYGNGILKDMQSSVLFFATREATAKEAKERGDRTKRYRYEGVFMVADFEYLNKNNEQRIRFQLVPAGTGGSQIMVHNILDLAVGNLPFLRAKLLGYRASGKKSTRSSKSEYFKRSKEVKQYALLRAKGKCESCSKPGPFFTKDREPFLEVHHIHRLADDGPDSIENVAALCPNCHREAHFGVDPIGQRNKLALIIAGREKIC
ncbi:HNH endonuclease [bacterium]|nr:HNH endonuclease [bacterium]